MFLGVGEESMTSQDKAIQFIHVAGVELILSCLPEYPVWIMGFDGEEFCVCAEY